MRTPEIGALAPEKNFEVGQTMFYDGRVYQIENIEGDEAVIFARESFQVISNEAIRRWGGPQQVAEKYGGVLEIRKQFSLEGEESPWYYCRLPADRKRIKLSELEKGTEAQKSFSQLEEGTNTIDLKLINAGFNQKVIKSLRKELMPKLKLPSNARALFLGPGVTPLQYLMAGDGAKVEVVENSKEVREAITGQARCLGLESSLTIYQGRDSNILTVRLDSDTYDIIFALNILDLVGESQEVYLKMLRAVRHGGGIAIGHYDKGIGTKEQNKLNQYAEELHCGLEDLKVVVDEGHQKTDHWYSEDSTLFRIHKEDIPGTARGKELSNVGDVLKLFASLR